MPRPNALRLSSHGAHTYSDWHPSAVTMDLCCYSWRQSHACVLLVLSITNSYDNIYSSSRENSGYVAPGQNSPVSANLEQLQRRPTPLQHLGLTLLSESCSFASIFTGVKLTLFLFTSSFTSQKSYENYVSSLLQSHIQLQPCGRTAQESIWPVQSYPLGEPSLLDFPDIWHSTRAIAAVSND